MLIFINMDHALKAAVKVHIGWGKNGKEHKPFKSHYIHIQILQTDLYIFP